MGIRFYTPPEVWSDSVISQVKIAGTYQPDFIFRICKQIVFCAKNAGKKIAVAKLEIFAERGTPVNGVHQDSYNERNNLARKTKRFIAHNSKKIKHQNLAVQKQDMELN